MEGTHGYRFFYIGWFCTLLCISIVLIPSLAHALPPCLGYFSDVFRQEALKRIESIARTQGDVVLFVGDSTTQMWSDDVFSGFGVPPKCGTAINSGVVDFTALPGVKVNLGLSGIRTCSWLYEWENTFAKKLASYNDRVKAVVINLGTNDVIQMSATTQLPATQVVYVQQLIDEMGNQFPNAHFIIHPISLCLNVACGDAATRASRVSVYNAGLSALNGYKGKTVYVQVPLKPSDLTPDQIHFNSCGYRKISQAVRYYVNQWAPSYTYPANLPFCLAFTPIHPCDL